MGDILKIPYTGVSKSILLHFEVTDKSSLVHELNYELVQFELTHELTAVQCNASKVSPMKELFIIRMHT